jgi:hypothetical protein
MLEYLPDCVSSIRSSYKQKEQLKVAEYQASEMQELLRDEVLPQDTRWLRRR